MKKLNTKAFEGLCFALLQLQNPVDMRLYFRSNPGWIHSHCGSYILKRVRHHLPGKYTHRITINIATAQEWREDVLSVIAHEFVHAWQTEKHPKSKEHGRTFQRKATQLRAALKILGFNLAPLYLPDTDK